MRCLLSIRVKREPLGHLPNEDLSVVRGGCDEAIVKRVPVGVQHGRGMAPEEGYLIGELAALVKWDDGEGATAARFPIDRQVLGIGLQK